MFIPVTRVGRCHSRAHSKCPLKTHPAPSHWVSLSHIHSTRGRKCGPFARGAPALLQTVPPLISFSTVSTPNFCHFQCFWKEEEKFQRTRESTPVSYKASRDIGGARNQLRDLTNGIRGKDKVQCFPEIIQLMLSPEVSGILELDDVLVFVQLIHRSMRTKHQLYKNPNIA